MDPVEKGEVAPQPAPLKALQVLLPTAFLNASWNKIVHDGSNPMHVMVELMGRQSMQ